MQFRGLIYMYQNRVNGKSYIGQTERPIRYRHREHIYAAQHSNKKGHNSAFQKAIRKYGIETFERVLLCTALSKESLNDLEVFFIKHFDTMNKDKGYNLTPGGLVTIHTTESKKKISEASKKMWTRPELKNIASECGKKNWKYLQTPEAVAKSAASKRGRPATETQKKSLFLGTSASRKPVICIKNDGSVQRFGSAREAAKCFNISFHSIYHACRGHIKKTNGMIWKYEQE